jgi:hypothetical protein
LCPEEKLAAGSKQLAIMPLYLICKTMDEYNSGMDPEMRRYFQKIMKTFGAVAFWLMLMAASGLYLRLGYFVNGLDWYNGIFYFVFFTSLFLMLRFLFRVWRKKE